MKKNLVIALLCLILVSCASAGFSNDPSRPGPAASQTSAEPMVATVEPTSTPTLPVSISTGQPATSPTAMSDSLGTVPSTTPKPSASTSLAEGELAFPIRAAFYYPWFPQSWKQGAISYFTHYHPTQGFYGQDDPVVIQQQIAAMQYGKIQAGIASWWGQGHYTDSRIPMLLEEGGKAGFRWSLYHEDESLGDPSIEAIRSDLEYIRDHYASSPAYLKINGRFVVFVYADQNDGCGMTDRWKQANTVGAYLVLKVFPGYRDCASQPDTWHQYAPDSSQKKVGKTSFTISPGFWKADTKKIRLARDLARWNLDIKAMLASKSNFQLISTFNEWGEGSSVESAKEWESPSGYGLYLDALHNDGQSQSVNPSPTPGASSGITLVGAGDIANCNLTGVAATTQLLDYFPSATLFTLGDNVYADGKPSEFQDCFAPTWGKYQARIHPAAGNHDYHTKKAAGYYGYFGAAAGDPEQGYYSYNLGTWHIIVLNSNCDQVGGCNLDSLQEQWLKNDLAANPALCTLAYWHHPLFSSGEHGDNPEMRDIWRDLYAAGVELVLNGHDHNYERFAPQNPDGSLDPERGIRQIVVGTGGAELRDVSSPYKPNSELVISQTYGVIKLDLQAASYAWTFLPVAGQTGSDAGSGTCHP